MPFRFVLEFQFYIGCWSLYLIPFTDAVYDVTRRETFTNLSEIWAKEIDLYSTNQDCIKMLVGNKVDKVCFKNFTKICLPSFEPRLDQKVIFYFKFLPRAWPKAWSSIFGSPADCYVLYFFLKCLIFGFSSNSKFLVTLDS